MRARFWAGMDEWSVCGTAEEPVLPCREGSHRAALLSVWLLWCVRGGSSDFVFIALNRASSWKLYEKNGLNHVSVHSGNCHKTVNKGFKP